jgi:tetratricopeptide (TPR) repeat protein
LFAIPTWSQQSLADKMIAQGHYNRARPLVQAVLEKHPKDPSALLSLSTIDWAFGQLDASTATAEKAVLAANDSALAHAQLLNALGAKLASSKTGTFDKLNLSRRFSREADRTLQLDPANLYAHEALARFYWYAPAVGGGSRPKARQWLDKLVQLDAVRGYALKAELDATESHSAKCPPAVLADWTQATRANPRSYEAHAGLGGCLLSRGNDKLRAVEDEAKKNLALDPSRIDSYRLLTAVYVATARWDQMDAVLRSARLAVPDDLAAEFIAAQTILDLNIASQWPRAEEHLRNYLMQPSEGLEPTIATAHWRLGIVLEKEGRKAAAIKELEIATNLDPSLEEAKKDLRRLR